MAESILVTGAAGFIAFHTIEHFLQSGIDVIGIDNFDPYYDVISKRKNIGDLREISKKTGSNFTFITHDILDINNLKLPLKISAVIHLAAKAGVRPSITDPNACFKANVDGTLQVLEFCKNNNIRKMLFGSSSSVYGNSTTSPFREDAECAKPISPYAASKRSGELLCFTYASLYKINIAALRFFTVYGPRQRPDLAIHKFSKMILNREPLPFFGGGNTSRDYTHVSDIVLGLKQAYHWVQIQPSGTFDIFNLGGNKTISLRHLVETLEECLGQKAALDHQPEQAGDVERTCADLTKSSSVLGYMPRISIHDGLKHFTKWILSEYAQPNSNRKVA